MNNESNAKNQAIWMHEAIEQQVVEVNKSIESEKVQKLLKVISNKLGLSVYVFYK